jgi:BRCT domain type II-containing protein
VTTETGAAMPLDPDPHPDGNVTPLPGSDDGHGRMVARVHGHRTAPQPAWRPHWATCPHADTHRTTTTTTTTRTSTTAAAGRAPDNRNPADGQTPLWEAPQ